MLLVIKVYVIRLSVVLLCHIFIVTLSVIMLCVVAPKIWKENQEKEWKSDQKNHYFLVILRFFNNQ